MAYKYQHYNYKTPFSQLKVLSEDEALLLCNEQPNKWNVISIWGGHGGVGWDKLTQTFSEYINITPEFKHAKNLCQQEFHDVDKPTLGATLCTEAHIKSVLLFASKHHGEPIISHCRAGISRSTAIAFLILLDAIKDKSEWPAEDALSMVYAVRPQMYPNRHIINIGIPLVARSEKEEIGWFRDLYNSDTMRRIRG